MIAIETVGLGRRYGRHWALRGLDLRVPEGAVVGLVGPNGAGKSTLLHLLTGLIEPSEGSARVLGGRPGSRDVLADVAFVAQGAPLPARSRISDLVAMASAMNRRWHGGLVTERIAGLALRHDQRVGELSGGQRAQLALALALAKRPRLVVLDEPVASLDPLARRSFLRSLMAAVADDRLTVVFSSHLIDDLERTCDHLALLGHGSLLLAGEIDSVLTRHAVLIGPPSRPLPRGARAVGTRTDGAHQHLVTVDAPIVDPHWEVSTPTLDEIVLTYLERDVAHGNGAEATRHLEVV